MTVMISLKSKDGWTDLRIFDWDTHSYSINGASIQETLTSHLDGYPDGLTPHPLSLSYYAAIMPPICCPSEEVKRVEVREMWRFNHELGVILIETEDAAVCRLEPLLRQAFQSKIPNPKSKMV
jgi:hypothetical protein